MCVSVGELSMIGAERVSSRSDELSLTHRGKLTVGQQTVGYESGLSRDTWVVASTRVQVSVSHSCLQLLVLDTQVYK